MSGDWVTDTYKKDSFSAVTDMYLPCHNLYFLQQVLRGKFGTIKVIVIKPLSLSLSETIQSNIFLGISKNIFSDCTSFNCLNTKFMEKIMEVKDKSASVKDKWVKGRSEVSLAMNSQGALNKSDFC